MIFVNALKGNQKMQALNSKIINTISSIKPLFVIYCLVLTGCWVDSGNWTEFNYYNYSKTKIRIDVVGITPDPSPGNTMPNDIGDSSPSASTEYGYPIKIDDTFTIIWTIETGTGEIKKEQTFNRDKLGIPASMKSGTITFTCTKDEKWEIKYSK
jgi:hypothetical protein